MSTGWKGRHELPVIAPLNIRFDIGQLQEELKKFAADKIWDGLGSDYAHMCETHTKLPKMFFKEKDYIFQKLAKNFSTKILKNLFFKNKLDEAKYFWKTDKNKESIRIILNSDAPNIFFKYFFSGVFLFKYSFILKIYSFFKSKKIDIEI